MEKLRHSRLLQQFWNVAGAAPIRVKVLGIVLGVIILLGGFVILQMRAVLTTTLLDEIGQQGISLSEHIAELAETRSLPDDRAMLRALLEGDLIHYSSHTHNTVVAYIALYMADQSLVVGTMPDLPPVPAADSGGPATRVLDSGRIFEIVDFLGDTKTQIRIGLSTINIQQIVNTVTFQLLTITLIMIAVGFAAAFFLTWILTRPLLELVNAAHDVARGDFSRRVARWANDEIGALATAFNSMTESLEQADTERTERETLRRRYVNGVIAAQENERQRIARELHDSTGQSLTSLLIGLQNLKQSQSDEELNHQIDDLRSTISATLDDVRTMSWRLRPSALDDLGLISALQHYIDDYRERYQIQVDLVASGIEERLPPELETAIYRIVQEGLTNIARYAQASTASVIVGGRKDLIRIIIEDNGIGFDPAIVQRESKSLGLQGIRERAALLGGSLTIESQPGQGTTLFIEIPYPPVDEMTRVAHERTHPHR